MTKKIVVTGGAGFIGSALVRALLARGDAQVVALDNLSSGKRENLEGVEGPLELVVADICNYDGIAPVIAGADTVFHLAAIPSVPRSVADPIPSHQVNTDGMFQVFRACHAGGVRRVVYAASSSAYGDTEVLPKVETMRANPLSPYAAQKLMGEYYASVFYNCYGLETVSLRFFNVFGPRQDPSSPYSGVLSIFNKCIMEGVSPTIYGDGEQSRDFTFVTDVAGLCIKASLAGPEVCGKVYNAGNGNRYTLNMVWETLQKIAGVSLPANYGPARTGDVKHSQADTTAAVRELGHAPQVSLEEGLRATLDWFRTL
ncbi:MAG: SDR family oxidoreductase [Bryobacterales bacterium]|nr:SDR family oxidoreductase [Bryobacterales bacterium]